MDSRFDPHEYRGETERRTRERLQLDVHLDDLQAELEAGARTLEKIDAEAFRVDDVLATRRWQAGITGDLLRQIRDLKHSVAQQRFTLRELRSEMQTLRRGLRRKLEER